MTSTEKSLVFSPREPGLIPWPLLGFILLSASVHAFGFFLFQTIYPAALRMNPPPPQVSLLAPGTPESDAILRWINSEDPALAAEPTRAPIPGLKDLPYIPSYQTPHGRPTMSPPQEAPLAWPGGVSGVELMKMASARTPAKPAPAGAAATKLGFSRPLETAGTLPSLDGLHQSADAGALQPARFLLGVSEAGEVRYVFLQESSGDKGLDADAATLLRQVKFRGNPGSITWGFATFFWGSAIFAAPPPVSEAHP